MTSRPAATAAGSFRVCTSDTTTGVSNRPILAAVETSALAIGSRVTEALDHGEKEKRGACGFEDAAADGPALPNLKVTLVRSARSIRGGHYPENPTAGDS